MHLTVKHLLLTGSFLTLGNASNLFGAPYFVTKSQSGNFRPDAAGLLFEQGQTKVWKPLDAKPEDYKNLYWVNFSGIVKMRDELQAYGEVVHFDAAGLAIMRLNDSESVFKLSATLHEQGMACGALVKLDGDVMHTPSEAAPVPMVDVATKLPTVEQMVTDVEATNIEVTVKTLEAIPTRYYRSQSGIAVADKLMAMYKPLANGRTDIEVGKFVHTGANIPQPSLKIRILGQEKPNEVVILGSHIDSINGMGSTRARAPGADDNASGTATNLEVFRVLMANGIKLKRTLEIHGYAAEELGLLGSADMAKKYKAQNVKVISMVQHDMNLYCESGPDKIWFVSNNTSQGFNAQLIKLLKSYLTVAFATASLSGGNSDHYSWTRNGFHAAFPFENPNDYNSHIHTAADTSANSGRFSQAAEFAKLAVAYIGHFAGFVEAR